MYRRQERRVGTRRRRSFSSSKPTGNNRRRGGGRSSGGNRRRGGGKKMPTFDPSSFINKNPQKIEEVVYQSKNTFDSFGLSEGLKKNIDKSGLVIPTPIQDQIIPEILNGKDVVGLAETGTGKTAAFLLPIIEKTIQDTKRQTLILTPTRELAIQVDQEFRKLGINLNLFSTICVGGMNIRPQIRSLSRTNHFIIGTPGRVLDLIRKKHIKTENITTVILDEADRMLDMGFINDMKEILSGIPKERETLFFSATMNDEAEKMVHNFLKNPITVSVKKQDVTNSIEQDVVRFKKEHKFQSLQKLLMEPEFEKVIIFGAMKRSVEDLSKDLRRAGITSESLHGNKNHSQRQKSLQRFKSGESQVLVATDVAARGIHVDDVTHVINYDLPNTFDDYVHRIGRTGRGNKKGKALTFVKD